MNALGVIDLDETTDLEADRRKLRLVAEQAGLELVDTVTFRQSESMWIFRVLEAVHTVSAHAVIVRDIRHLHGYDRAIVGAADLYAGDGYLAEYIGYGRGHRRASAPGGEPS